MKKVILATGTFFACLLWVSTSAAISPEVIAIQQSWAAANYQLKGDDQDEAMQSLIDRCQNLLSSRPKDPEVLVWCGIVKSTYAGVLGGLSALKYAKAARVDLQNAIDIEPGVMAGSAQTSLGTLYNKVPGWPLGFGSEKKARALLLAGIEASPTGIDSNYFYADFLYENGELEKAHTHLLRALQAGDRAGRAVADEGRRAEIAVLLATIETKLGED